MTYVSLASKAILRGDLYYFKSYTAFNARTFKSIALSLEQYNILQDALDSACSLDNLRKRLKTAELTDESSLLKVLLKEGILKTVDFQPLTSKHTSFSPQKAFQTPLPLTSSPTQIELCMTRRCNLACFHCNISAYSERSSEKLDIAFWKDFLDQCIESKVLRLTITGGEPFIRQGWDELYTYLAKLPIAVIILINATRIREDHMKIMAYEGHTVSISLDGVNPEQHDDFRRTPGAFEKTLQTMRKLSEHGVPISINTVMHSKNIHEVEKIYYIAKEVGAKTLVLVPMAAIGRRASNGSKKYFPKNRDLLKAFEKMRIRGLQELGPKLCLGSNFDEREMIEIDRTHSGATQISKRPPGFCKAGIYGMAVDQDGLAYSCLRGLQTRIHPIGDLKKQSLQEIWSAQ